MLRKLYFAVAVVLGLSQESLHGQGATAVRETAEWMMQKFGRQIGREGVQSLSVKLEQYVARHGEDFLQAIRKVGPRAFRLVDDAGTQAAHVVGIMSRHGEKGVVHLLARPQAMNIVTRLGPRVESAMIQHPVVAERVLETFGAPAIQALEKLGPQAGRRLAMMTESGEWARLARSDELLGVLGRWGDKAMQFVWDHKGALMVTGAMTTFLANPEPFINGTVKLTGEVISVAVKPLAEVPKVIAEQAASSMNWTLVTICSIVACSLVAAWKFHRRQSLCVK